MGRSIIVLNKITPNKIKSVVVIKKFINRDEISKFQELYEELPVEINNQRQKILKKKWSSDFDLELQKK